MPKDHDIVTFTEIMLDPEEDDGEDYCPGCGAGDGQECEPDCVYRDYYDEDL